MGKECESPLKEVIGSTLLGSMEFVEFIKDTYVTGKESVKDVPALKHLIQKADLTEIFDKVDAVFKEDKALSRGVKMYLAQRYSGRPLREIADHFNIG